ncbi:hypothetical protein [Paenibacillus nasutitermitis]|uniref:SH3 domain protein n=1 Tax=Paenibacillus nasutitermitis TaxID=1652958 RepID=A0A917DYX7_9BACL|nr:hypothetical protein [Paenibacillus nasutitermitis]GGD83294.1 hypothetical protein GCM10010911_46830 [Paenibacillus nasutitermitis]
MRFGKWGLSFACVMLLTGASANVAHAGFVDNVKGIFKLPEEVDELRNQYDSTKTKLEEVTKQSQETIEQYRQAGDRLHEENIKLMEQNENLAKRNDELSQAVISLQASEEARSAKSKRLWLFIYSGIGLLAFYFLSGRLLRLLLRSRQA